MEADQSSYYSEERIGHFHCTVCNGWWSIGDPPKEKTEWFCPWCGAMQKNLKQ